MLYEAADVMKRERKKRAQNCKTGAKSEKIYQVNLQYWRGVDLYVEIFTHWRNLSHQRNTQVARNEKNKSK